MRNAARAALAARDHTPLAVRGSSPHIFRSLGLFLEASLLFCGGYLLAESMLSPLSAGSVSVLAGGLFLALASVLLFYLLWPTYVKATYRKEAMQRRRIGLFANASAHSVLPNAEAPWNLQDEKELPGPM